MSGLPSVVFVYRDAAVTREFAPTHYRERIEVQAYVDPVDALARIHGGDPCALVMCDLRFPTLMGLDFLLEARRSLPGAKTVIFGAPGEFPALLRARQAGVDAYVLKSLVPPERRVFPTADRLLAEWAQEQGHAEMQAMFPMPRIDDKLVVREVGVDELDAALEVVRHVYGSELGRLADDEAVEDEHDATAVHFLATYDGAPVGSARGVIYDPGSGHRLPMESKFDLSAYKSERLGEAGRFVILKEHRGGVTSRAMLYQMLMWASRHDVRHVAIASRPELVDTYEGLGFRAFQAPARNHKRAYAAVPMHLHLDQVDIRFQRLLAVAHPNVVRA